MNIHRIASPKEFVYVCSFALQFRRHTYYSIYWIASPAPSFWWRYTHVHAISQTTLRGTRTQRNSEHYITALSPHGARSCAADQSCSILRHADLCIYMLHTLYTHKHRHASATHCGMMMVCVVHVCVAWPCVRCVCMGIQCASACPVHSTTTKTTHSIAIPSCVLYAYVYI